MDWEVGEILESPRYNSSLVTGEKGKFLSEVDLHNLLLNGTIEKVEENKRWRAETGGVYYYIGCFYDVFCTHDYTIGDNNYYNIGNYFQTRKQAQTVADKIKQLLKESHD